MELKNRKPQKRAKPSDDRGLRAWEVFNEIFGNVSRLQVAKILGVSDPTIIGWEKGASIDNETLAKIASKGGDVIYILTGVRTADLEYAKLARIAQRNYARLQKLLAAVHESRVQDPGRVGGWAAQLSECIEVFLQRPDIADLEKLSEESDTPA